MCLCLNKANGSKCGLIVGLHEAKSYLTDLQLLVLCIKL